MDFNTFILSGGGGGGGHHEQPGDAGKSIFAAQAPGMPKFDQASGLVNMTAFSSLMQAANLTAAITPVGVEALGNIPAPTGIGAETKVLNLFGGKNSR